MFIATLIAADELKKGDLSSASDRLNQAGCEPSETSEIFDGKTADIVFADQPEIAREALTSLGSQIDFGIVRPEIRRKKLLISDMDSTMITVECIDELADYAGIKDQIVEITERAMQGELDFEQALHSRVALLAGLSADAIQKCLNERVELMAGGAMLVKTMRNMGAETILVSGGFTSFANPVAKNLGFAHAEANILEIKSGQLSGKLTGPIVDAVRKAEILKGACEKYGLQSSECVAVGDGANDIPMIEMAGLGVAYHAKPKASKAADVAINHNDLTSLLYLQGIRSNEWVTD